MPEVRKRSWKDRKNSQKLPEVLASQTSRTPPPMAAKFHRVTGAPPELSASQPPMGLIREPMSGPAKATAAYGASGKRLWLSRGKAVE
ncbi:hypothetical protein GCM10020220_085260 [Nonomuraea rubra]